MGVKLVEPLTAVDKTTRSITGWSIGQGHHAAAAATTTISAHSDLGTQQLSREQKLNHAF